MQLLTALTTRLADDEIGRVYSRRRRLMSCSRRWMTRRHATFCLFFQRANYRLRNGCPAGIAHTYMAAEYLEKAGRNSA